MSREDQKRQVQQATDIVRLVGEQVALKARGKEFLGLCPFHDDKNPSMHVSPAKQIYKCFSCGAGGDVFSFVMNYHKLTFPEALKMLAEKVGIKLVFDGPRGRGGEGSSDDGPTDRERISDANTKAVSFYRALFRHAEHGQLARAYVEKRRINAEMVEAFQIGYAPDRWDGLALMIADKQWDQRAFEMAGLISQRNRDGDNQQSAIGNRQSFYDRLRHRLIFPIFDAIGRPIAFGGRKLREEDEPKYLNSPETPLFNKSATLYGLHLAKKPIIDSKTAVIVEGYTDVIACHQAGVRNVVATLGTALTLQHVQALKHFCDKVVLVYDGDEAGLKASDRAVEVFVGGSLDVHIAVIPGELDPADLFELPDGIERWNSAIGASSDAMDFQFRRVKAQYADTATLAGRQKVAEDYLRKLAEAGLENTGVLRKAMLVQRLAELLHMQESVVGELIKRLTPARSAFRGNAGGPSAGNASSPGDPASRGVFSSGNGASENNAAGVADNADSTPVNVASGVDRHKIMSLRQAERELLGCLLRDPRLFSTTLADGREACEAVTPAEFVSTDARELYEMVHTVLSDGRELTLSGLLGDLAAIGRQDLSNLATRAEAEVERVTGANAERLAGMFRADCQTLVAYHSEQEMRVVKRNLLNAPGTAPGTDPAPGTAPGNAAEGESPALTQEQVLRRVVEFHRANPHKGRIGRPKV